MRGYLIYKKEDIARNERFIMFFTRAAEKRGVTLELITVDRLSVGVASGAPYLLPEKPDFAVVRAMLPALSRQLEACGVTVFNCAYISEICNDKQRTHGLLALNGIPTMDTAFVSSLQPSHPFPYPVVVKACAGCGGRQVFLCENEEQYLEKLRIIAPDTAVTQPLCNTPGRDVRAYVLNRRIVQAMLRRGDGDFRSNFGLHGHADRHTLSPEERALVERVIALFPEIGLIGIDMIYHGGKPLINEIEDAVGTRMLYQFTDLDMVDMYMDSIVKKLS